MLKDRCKEEQRKAAALIVERKKKEAEEKRIADEAARQAAEAAEEASNAAAAGEAVAAQRKKEADAQAAAARAALSRAIAEAEDPGALPRFPAAVKAAGGGRLQWTTALQFPAVRDLPVRARTPPPGPGFLPSLAGSGPPGRPSKPGGSSTHCWLGRSGRTCE